LETRKHFHNHWQKIQISDVGIELITNQSSAVIFFVVF